MVGGRIAAVLWDVASRTCSILLVAFLCNCRCLVSVHIVHPVILIVISALDTVTEGLVQGLEDLEIRGRV